MTAGETRRQIRIQRPKIIQKTSQPRHKKFFVA